MSSIECLPQCQARAGLDPETVAEYREAIGGGVQLPAVVVFFDADRRYRLADGWHRIEAAGPDGIVLAEVMPGGEQEAAMYACGANAAHGRRRTTADKVRAVQLALERVGADPRWSGEAIARHCGVSREMVSQYRKPNADVMDVSAGQSSETKTSVSAELAAAKAAKAAERERKRAEKAAAKAAKAAAKPSLGAEADALEKDMAALAAAISDVLGDWTRREKGWSPTVVRGLSWMAEQKAALRTAAGYLRHRAPHRLCPEPAPHGDACRCLGAGWLDRDAGK